MSARSLLIGVLLGTFVAGLTYVNDHVIRQTMLIGSHLPVIVFGLLALLMLGINPLWRGRGGRGGLRPAEVATVAALALAACGWPGNGFYRCFTSVAAMPAQLAKTQPTWIEADVFSFLPGGSGALAPEHLVDVPSLARQLKASADQPQTPLGRWWLALKPEDRSAVAQVAQDDGSNPRAVRAMVDGLNRALAEPLLYEPGAFEQVALPEALRARLSAAARGQLDRFEIVRCNRMLLAIALPDWVRPLPAGQGVLLEGAKPDTPTLQTLLAGAQGSERLRWFDVPLSLWWPTLRLWGGVILMLGLASLCLALIVHPQWSKRELLPYPIVRVVEELARTAPGHRLPEIACHRGFWVALALVSAIHAVNGLHAYFEAMPEIPLRLSFTPLRELFPNAARVFGSEAYFEPRIFLSTVGFAFVLATPVSFSMGIAHLLFMVLGAFLIARGIPFERDYLGGSKVNMMSFGSFLAMVVIILYTGRRYYANVVAAMAGRPLKPETPAHVRWAGWGLVASMSAAVALLHTGGLAIPLGAGLVGLILTMWLVVSRISAETGMFLIKPAWLPVGILTALLGFESIGPTGYLVLAIATIMLVGDAREVVMGFLTNGLRLAEQAGEQGPRRIVPWLAFMLVWSLLVAGAVTLIVQHNVGLNQADNFALRTQPVRPFTELTRHIYESRLHHGFTEAVAATGLDRLSLVRSDPDAWLWLGVGFVLVLGTAAARLRLSWWPLHPVLFLVWGTWPMFVFSFSLLLGWLAKTLVVGTGGARGYHAALPVAVGVILADLLSALSWSLVGAAYYLASGAAPPAYRIFPT